MHIVFILKNGKKKNGPLIVIKEMAAWDSLELYQCISFGFVKMPLQVLIIKLGNLK